MQPLPVADLLLEKNDQLESLVDELIKSYQKELRFTEQVLLMETEIAELRRERDRAVKHLRTLQASPLGRAQRWYWRMRKRVAR